MKAEGYYAVVPEWVLALDSRAVHLYAVLRRYADTGGKAWPSHRTLAKRVGCSPDTITRILGRLEAAGAITTEERYREDGGRTSNTYTLRTTPPCTDAVGVPRTDAVAPPAPVRHHEPKKKTESQIELAAGPRECAQQGCIVRVPCWIHDAGFADTYRPEHGLRPWLFNPTAGGNQRDLLWEAMEVAVGGRPATKAETGRYARAVKELRDAGYNPNEVLALAQEYRRRWPKVDCTPTGLAANAGLLSRSRAGSVQGILDRLGAS